MDAAVRLVAQAAVADDDEYDNVLEAFITLRRVVTWGIPRRSPRWQSC